ncbi:OsmC family protein [Nakamurella lactea]|uniref:OsmC family protein n=1 Tax=Nakamurella lactea TaxID=459515 RepID=UPI00040B4FAD|nr:OsmC family protein [Nakamurella lactea]
MNTVHHYRSELRWAGSTGVGYDAYDRRHRLTAAPAEQPLELSSDPAFLGDPSLLNPEQLLLAAASSCQLLSFLAVAARARLDVVGYTDAAEAEMDEADRPTRITTIRLNPVITLADTDRQRPTDERLRKLVDIAHHECFIANSVTARMLVTAEFGWAA